MLFLEISPCALLESRTIRGGDWSVQPNVLLACKDQRSFLRAALPAIRRMGWQKWRILLLLSRRKFTSSWLWDETWADSLSTERLVRRCSRLVRRCSKQWSIFQEQAISISSEYKELHQNSFSGVRDVN